MEGIIKTSLIIEISEDDVSKNAAFIAECKAAFHTFSQIKYLEKSYFVTAYEYYFPNTPVAYRITLGL
jgi:hypothetical protein